MYRHTLFVIRTNGLTLNREKFQRNYVRPLIPVVIENLLSNWKASARWTWKNLRTYYGERTVRASYDPEGVCSNRCYVNLSFEEYLDRMDEGSLYLTEVHLPTVFPELMADIVMPELVPPLMVLSGRQPNAWFSSANVSKSLHYDTSDNLLCQVMGRKQVLLFSPDQSVYMYPDNHSKFPHNSRIRNPAKVDLSQFPEFANTRACSVIIGSGDVLYIPPGWWHFTTSIEHSISVNYWWVNT